VVSVISNEKERRERHRAYCPYDHRFADDQTIRSHMDHCKLAQMGARVRSLHSFSDAGAQPGQAAAAAPVVAQPGDDATALERWPGALAGVPVEVYNFTVVWLSARESRVVAR
jgi:hypothetical protein